MIPELTTQSSGVCSGVHLAWKTRVVLAVNAQNEPYASSPAVSTTSTVSTVSTT